MIDKYRILIKKNEIIDKGVRTKDQGDVSDQEIITSIGNIVVKKDPGENNGDLIMLSEKVIDGKIKGAHDDILAQSHKQIAGSIEFDTKAEFEQAKTDWDNNQGIDLIDDDGNPIHYTKAIAKVGDVIFVSSSKGSTDADYFYPEEIVIKNANKDAELFTHNNENAAAFKNIDVYKTQTDAKLQTLTDADTRINTHLGDLDTQITDRYTKAQVDNSQAAQDTKINTNKTAITTLDGRVGANEGNITTNTNEMTSIEARVKATEDALSTLENKWTGDMPLAATIDVSVIPGSLGPFSFKQGDKIDIVIGKGADEISEVITAGGNPVPFIKDTHQIEIQLAVGGVLTVTSSTSDDITTWHVKEAIQKDNTGTLNPGYTKSESDAKYPLKTTIATEQAAQDTKIAANVTALNTKQNKNDNGLNTTTKIVVGAINENKANIDTTIQDVNNLNETKTTGSDGTGGKRAIQDLDPTVDNDNIVIRKTLDEEMPIIRLKYDRTHTGPQTFNINKPNIPYRIYGMDQSKHYNLKVNSSHGVSFTGRLLYNEVNIQFRVKNNVFNWAKLMTNYHGSLYGKDVNHNIFYEVESLDIFACNNTFSFTITEYTGATDEATVGPNLVDAELNTKANIDLSNVNVGTSHSGKILQVKADGTLEYVENSGGGYNIQFYKGQILSFNEIKTGTKFEDTSLFTKKVIPEYASLIGGTDLSTFNGEVISHNHLVGYIKRGDTTNTISKNGTDNGEITVVSGDTGGTHNKAYGVQALKVIYIAKKDITFGEMR